ncbi:MAG: hypothetical protein ISEC1_P2066 [Thiomicrorhabdus sp.]|nr:MAG: hypothetical protein ISEC1_P2066 [Thiomicrorhabdus sp.]
MTYGFLLSLSWVLFALILLWVVFVRKSLFFIILFFVSANVYSFYVTAIKYAFTVAVTNPILMQKASQAFGTSSKIAMGLSGLSLGAVGVDLLVNEGTQIVAETPLSQYDIISEGQPDILAGPITTGFIMKLVWAGSTLKTCSVQLWYNGSYVNQRFIGIGSTDVTYIDGSTKYALLGTTCVSTLSETTPDFSSPIEKYVTPQSDSSGTYYLDDLSQRVPVYTPSPSELIDAYSAETGQSFDFLGSMWDAVPLSDKPIEYHNKTYSQASVLANDYLGTNDPDILQNIDSLPSPTGVVSSSDIVPTDSITTTLDTVKLDEILNSISSFTSSTTYGSGINSVNSQSVTNTAMIVNSIEAFKDSNLALQGATNVLIDDLVAVTSDTSPLLSSIVLSTNETTVAVNGVSSAVENLAAKQTDTSITSDITFSSSLTRLYDGFNASPLILSLNSISFTGANGTAVCPTYDISFSIMGFDFSENLNSYCSLLESQRSVLSGLFTAIYFGLALFIFLRA